MTVIWRTIISKDNHNVRVKSFTISLVKGGGGWCVCEYSWENPFVQAVFKTTVFYHFLPVSGHWKVTSLHLINWRHSTMCELPEKTVQYLSKSTKDLVQACVLGYGALAPLFEILTFCLIWPNDPSHCCSLTRLFSDSHGRLDSHGSNYVYLLTTFRAIAESFKSNNEGVSDIRGYVLSV